VIGVSHEQRLSRNIYIVTEIYTRLLELEPTTGSFAEVVRVIDCDATAGAYGCAPMPPRRRRSSS
jgi:hypothetical protein